MTSYIQIAGDPTKWWPEQPFNASLLAGQPVSVQIISPVTGFLVISSRAAGVAVFELNQAAPADLNLPAPGIYVPSATGLSAGHTGYDLPASVDLGTLAGQLATLMRDGGSQTITLGGASSGGALVLNGATLSFAVLLQASAPEAGDAGAAAPPEVGAAPPPEAGAAPPHKPDGVVPHG
jgi:hypothetical protein